MRHLARAAVLALSMLVLLGCTTLPTQGPIQQVGSQPTSQQSGGVDIAPQPPRQGGDPEAILAGFLAAMASFEPGFRVAREYLTPQAQKVWTPESGLVIYESENNKPITTDRSAILNVQRVGTLDAQGHYSSISGKLVHDFAMTRVEGEWRIGQPPRGLLMARYLFNRYYQSVPITFLTADGTRLAPESIHLPAGQVNPTAVVKGLLAGPSGWLGPAVRTAFPGDTKMSVNAVTVREGIAEVGLTGEIAALAEPQRTQLAVQLVSTLSYFSHIRGVRILANGQPWPVADAVDGVVAIDAFPSWDVVDLQSEARIHVVKEGRVGLIDPRTTGGIRYLGGRLGRGGWGEEPGLLAAHRTGDVLAVLNRQRSALYVAQAGGEQVTRRHTGTRLVRPQVMADRSVWMIDHTGAEPALVVVPSTGASHTIALPGLRGAEVVSFRVSPDRTRVAMVGRRDNRTVLGLMRVRGAERITLDAWRELPLLSSSGALNGVLDVGWAEPEVMLVLAAPDAASVQWNIYRITSDGSRVENLGPSGAAAGPVGLSVMPRRLGTTAAFVAEDGSAHQFEGAYRWQRVATGISAITLPG